MNGALDLAHALTDFYNKICHKETLQEGLWGAVNSRQKADLRDALYAGSDRGPRCTPIRG